MFTSAFFIRCLIAVLVAILALAVIPAVLRLVGFPVNGDVVLIIRAVVAIVALFYIFRGTSIA